MLECGLLRLHFTWRGDRFAHAVSRADAPDAGVLLESLEGADSEAWPPSGPLQSLHVEQQPGSNRVALLVGMAGRSHWSAAVELFPEQSRMRWDIASRVAAGAAGHLGSCYRVAGQLEQLDGGGASVDPANADRRGLVVRPDESVGPVRLMTAEDRLDIVAEPNCSSASPATVRWSYFIEACSR